MGALRFVIKDGSGRFNLLDVLLRPYPHPALHFGIDVVAQFMRGKRPPGAATTLYYGLTSAYALSQILFGALALLALSQGLAALGRWPGLTLGFLAASSWMAICVLFLEYWLPRMTVALFVVLLTAAALTSGRTRIWKLLFGRQEAGYDSLELLRLLNPWKMSALIDVAND